MLREIHNDAYALAWILGVAFAVTWVGIYLSRAVAWWLLQIEKEKARRQAEDDLLRRAMARSGREASDTPEFDKFLTEHGEKNLAASRARVM